MDDERGTNAVHMLPGVATQDGKTVRWHEETSRGAKAEEDILAGPRVEMSTTGWLIEREDWSCAALQRTILNRGRTSHVVRGMETLSSPHMLGMFER